MTGCQLTAGSLEARAASECDGSFRLQTDPTWEGPL